MNKKRKSLTVRFSDIDQSQSKDLKEINAAAPKAFYLPSSLPEEPKFSRLVKRVPTSVKITEMLKDALPEMPSADDPSQRVLKSIKKIPHPKFAVSLTAAGPCEVHQYVDPDAYERKRIRRQSCKTRSIYLPSVKSVRTRKYQRIFLAPLKLINYQPFLSPFVPNLLRILINSIEAYCYNSSWNCIFEELFEYYDRAKIAFLQLLKVFNNNKAITKLVGDMEHPVQIVVVRLFLNELAAKPLHFNRSLMPELSQSPVFDFFLRPNIQIRKLVMKAVLQSSTCHTDTLVFLMIHLLHAREYAPDRLTGRHTLTSIYGRLLISFVEKPYLRGTALGEGRKLEDAMLEVMLELCDQHFWNRLSGFRIRPAFEQLSRLEKKHLEEEEERRKDSGFMMSRLSVVKSLETEEKLAPTETDPQKNILQMSEASKGSSLKSDTTDTQKEVHSAESTMTSYRMELSESEKTVQEPDKIGHISQTVPHLLGLAELVWNKREMDEAFAAIKLSKEFSGICRSTREILRDITNARRDCPAYRKKISAMADWFYCDNSYLRAWRQ
ncbi:hypothetical protein X801_04252 [Opisthorchis viverrini]|uniref:Uncharacterized protein n=2 Tax=Opisthorchis viverrini TaxID=6198 RepID=A0A074Z5P8_OPIVI|nr:hypothetical protein T265_14871 [Opisthorchis viverrini]KER22398.1 hypothetical protein T265_14871 [Opisthorchis viverrini]OON19874.1 hypothetical protein X801_04252 [Opisthorchis viverrini]